MHHPTDRIIHTTAFVTPVVEHWLEREIAQWVHYEGSIRWPITPMANALNTELHLAPLEKRKKIWYVWAFYITNQNPGSELIETYAHISRPSTNACSRNKVFDSFFHLSCVILSEIWFEQKTTLDTNHLDC